MLGQCTEDNSSEERLLQKQACSLSLPVIYNLGSMFTTSSELVPKIKGKEK